MGFSFLKERQRHFPPKDCKVKGVWGLEPNGNFLQKTKPHWIKTLHVNESSQFRTIGDSSTQVTSNPLLALELAVTKAWTNRIKQTACCFWPQLAGRQPLIKHRL